MKLLYIFILVFCCQLAHYVNGQQQCYIASADGDDVMGNGTQSNPWATFTPAFSNLCDVIYVDFGSYTSGDNRGFSIDYCVDILRWDNGPNSLAATEAIVNLNSMDRFIEINGPANGSAVHIDKVNFRNGFIDGGGGVIKITGCDLFMSDLYVKDSDTSLIAGSPGGGAIHAFSSSTIYVELNNTLFEGNTATSVTGNGGAILLQGDAVNFNEANLTAYNSTFRNNYAKRGGAIAIETRSRAIIIDSTFEDNIADPSSGSGAAGGALYAGFMSLLETDSCIFTNNTALGDSNFGGAVATDLTSTQVHEDGLFCSNTALGSTSKGGAIHGDTFEFVQFSLLDSVFQNNLADIIAMNDVSPATACSSTPLCHQVASTNGTTVCAGAVIPANPNPVDCYVSQLTGSDANPGTLGMPLATVSEAISRLCKRVHLFPETFDDTVLVGGNRGFNINYAIEVFHDVATGAGEAIIDLLNLERFLELDTNPDNSHIHDVTFINGYEPGNGGVFLVTGQMYTRTPLELERVIANASHADGSDPARGGGVVHSEDAKLLVTDSVFSCNSAGSTVVLRAGGVIRVLDNTGDPIHLDTTTQIISGSTFLFNFADRGGAVVFSRPGWARVLNSEFSHNTALTEGGGLRATRTGDIMVNGTKFVCNVAAEGGGYHLETKAGGPGSVSYLDGDMFCNNVAVNSIGTGIGGGYNRGISGAPIASETFLGANTTFQCNYAQTVGSTHTGPPVEIPCNEDTPCNILAPGDTDGDGICDSCDMFDASNNCSVSVAIAIDTSLNIIDFPQYIEEIKNHLILPFAETFTTIALYSFETEARIHTTYVDLSVTGNAENLCKFIENIQQGSTLDENWASVFELIADTSPLNSPDYVVFLPGANRNLPMPMPGLAARNAADLLRLNGNTRIISVGVYSSTLHRIVSGPTHHPCPDGDGEDEFTLHFDYFNSDNITDFGDVLWNKVGALQLCCSDIQDECGVCNGDDSKCLGCDNVPNSCLVFDECNVCDGDDTCDDGDPCTENECSGGMCVVTGPAVSGTPCDADGDPCTKDDMCDGNFTCVAGQNRETIPMAMGGCADGMPCTFDICTPINATDFNCTSIDRTTVSNNTCYEMHPNFVFNPLKHCGCNDGLFCTEDLCDMNGDCANPPKTMGTLANIPGNVTGMVGDPCGGGMFNGAPAICQMGTVICDEVNDQFICNGTILPQAMDDCGVNGTGNGIDENCNGVVDEGCGVACVNYTDCVPFAPQCSYAFCDANNTCRFDGDIDRQGNPTGPPILGLSCNDTLVCTVNDTCDGSGGIGVPAACMGVVDCDDLVDCHAKDVCNFTSGECIFPDAMDGTLCDDADPCTIDDMCINGTCVGMDKVPIPIAMGGCNDMNPCTNETCDANTGDCIYVNNTLPCDDGDPCTINDTCINGACVGISKLSLSLLDGGCLDDNQCTLDQCHPIHGNCTYKLLIGNSCNDMNACTANDTCTVVADPISVQCIGQNITCTDGNTCTDDTCDTQTGCVFTPNDNNTCLVDPDDPCKGGFCWGGMCEGDILHCDDMEPCSEGECDGGTCMYQPVLQGEPCDDGDSCTENDVCLNGQCVGTPRTCDDQNECTDDSCDTLLGCIHQANNNNTCTDGNLCTDDQCVNGICQSTPVSCVDDGNPCTDDFCDTNTGNCVHPDNSLPCDDGDPCTQLDICSNGVCTGFDPVDCTTNDPCKSSSCDSNTGMCVLTDLPDLTPCPDADLCTTDQCMSGTCIHTPIVCDDQNVCTQDFCVSGNCVFTNIYAPCDDGLFCTVNDHCYNGTCQGEPNDCGEDGLFCNGVLTCNENTDMCELVPTDCDDGNACTVDICDEMNDTCTHTPIAGVGDPCGIDTGACEKGTKHCVTVNNNPVFVCVGDIGPEMESCGVNGTGNGIDEDCDGIVDEGCGTNCAWPQDCPPLLCHTALCVNHTCVYEDNNGIPCDDGDLCTINDICLNGICQGTPKSQVLIANGGCHDNNECTDDSCDPMDGGCLYTQNNSTCDDGFFCTVNDICVNGMCTGTPRQCPNPQNDPCKEGVCDELDQQCELSALNNVTCDDNNVCTLNDTCVWGMCTGTPISCDDGNPCTDDVCDPQQGCLHIPNDSLTCHDSNLCDTEQCISGQCVSSIIPCNPVNICYNATCDPNTGICSQQQLPNNTPCDDGIPCTENDQCHNGYCSGTPKNCDDGNPCTTDFCEANSGICMNINNDTLPCDDGNACTVGDMCINGQCISGPLTNCDDQNVCTTDQCDSQTGQCIYTNIVVPCDDGDPCTIGDICSNGTCQPGLPKYCDDHDVCTTDTCNSTTGLCEFEPIVPCIINQCHLVNGSMTCEDGDLCTVGDFCVGYTCVSGPPKNCDDSNPCTIDSCNPSNGNCVYVNNNQTYCDDGDPCTIGDHCVNGVCIGNPIDCDDQNACTQDFCDYHSGQCVHAYNNGISCDDGDACTHTDICNQGQCEGTPINCNDNNQCTIDQCDQQTGQCSHIMAALPCDNGDPCTVNDTCHYGVCIGDPINCDDNNPCTNDTCDPYQGGCVNTPISISCDDGNPCTLNDTCINSQCIGILIDCNDNNECTDDFCDTNTGQCVNDNNNSNMCSDGDLCTENDECHYGQCVGTPKNCTDGNICTSDVCNPQNGHCENINNNAPCDDGDPCTIQDTCQNGVCQGLPNNCNDFEPCTTDYCEPTNGTCIHIKFPDWTHCDDGDLCTQHDACVHGVCTGIQVNCNDGNVCTDDFCDPQTGLCDPINHNRTCDDGDVCTINDRCENGLCVGDPAIDCNDNNECTTDVCAEDPITGLATCFHNDIVALCDDGDLCTINDLCSAGVCQGTPINCNDGNPCTSDVCNPNTGLCEAINNNDPCDDGDLCTQNDLCFNGQCIGIPLECDDGDQCTANDCDPQTGQCLNTPLINQPCDDYDPCTLHDKCIDTCVKKRWIHSSQSCVQCVGTPLDCNDGNECTNNTCNHQTGQCEAINNMQPCDDGNPCTYQDTCINGVCIGLHISCDDGNFCTDDHCDINTGQCVNTANDNNICTDGNACTLGDMCVNGTCTYWDEVTCNSTANPCITDTCNPLDGKCVPLEDYTPCDDGDLCTSNDHCKDGECVGYPMDCNDFNDCTHDVCFHGTCLYADNDGSPCDDGDPCTVSDTCVGNTCVGTPKNCTDGNICTEDECNPSTGICDHINNMVPCDDGNPCTTGDHCDAGQCVGAPVVCNDNNQCTTDTCVGGTCVYNATDGASCDDGNLCTLNDTCVGSVCTGTAVVCVDLGPCIDNPCINGVCTPMNNNDPCDDGDSCTENDVCSNGVCQGTPINCDEGNPCTNNTCVDGMCFLKNLNGTHCYDGDHCTFNDICINGQCVGTPIVCEDGNPCTNNVCLDGVCVFSNNTDPCDDGDLCTFDDRCVGGQCIGTPISCNDYNECTQDECILGQCHHFPIGSNLWTHCDDGDNCTHSDMCVNGQCIGTPIDCNDGNICTTNECDPQTGECVIVNNELYCDDGDICTTHDVCVNGTCLGEPMDCDDGDPCTEDVCVNGNCFHRQMYNEPCDDTDPCTVNDTCVQTLLRDNGYLSCIGEPKICNDGNVCTEDECNPSTGNCETTNNNLPCDDGNPCTLNDVCNNGTCSGVLRDCEDNNVCTFGICDTLTGNCMYTYLNVSCDDGDLCTHSDFCIEGQCVGIPVDCDDGDVCTINDRCNATTGQCEYDPFDCDDSNECTSDVCLDMGGAMCFHKNINDGHYCDDGDLCTDHDTCIEGECIGIPKSCGNGNVCTSGTCDPNTGNCTVMHNNDPCDDGNACTENDVCINGACLGTPKYCHDDNPCTDDSCNPVTGCVFTPNMNACYIDDKEGWCTLGECEINCELDDGCDPSNFTFSWNTYYNPNNNVQLIGDQLISARSVQGYNATHNKISKQDYAIPVGDNVTAFVESDTLTKNDTTVLAFLIEDDGDIYFYAGHDSEDSYNGGYVEMIIFEGDLRGDLVHRNTPEDTYQWLSSIGYGRFKWSWYPHEDRGLVIGPIPETKVMCFTVWFKHVEYIDQISIATFDHDSYSVNYIQGPTHPENAIIHICRTAHVDDYVLPSYPPPNDFCCDPEISDDVLALTVVIRDFHKDHPDFDGSYLGPDFGIVKDKLGYDSKPIYGSKTKTPSTEGAYSFEQWFKDVPGINKKKEITLEFTKVNGVYVFESDKFFPIDDILFGNEYNNHNYHFTGEIHSNFTYDGGEVFKVGSYDDLFLFINGKLVVNFGGVGSLDIVELSLDSIATLVDIKVGDVVRFDLFFTQRHVHKSGIYFGTSCNIDNCFCLDECAMCNGVNQICRGCDGELNSGLVYDECGVCGGYGTTCDCHYGILKEDKTCLCIPGWGGDSCNVCGHPDDDDKKYLCKLSEDDDEGYDKLVAAKLPFKYQREAVLNGESALVKKEHFSFNGGSSKSKLSKYKLITVDYDDVAEYISSGDYILPDSYGKDGLHYDCRCMPYGFNYTKHIDDLFHDVKGGKSHDHHSTDTVDTIFGSIWVIAIIVIIVIIILIAAGGGFCYKTYYCDDSHHPHHTHHPVSQHETHHFIIGHHQYSNTGQNEVNRRSKPKDNHGQNGQKTIISTGNGTQSMPKLKLVPEKMK